ncbi:MAG: hypothetical protein V9F04_06645 [Dermatophilaceae bacterium]
MSPVAEIHDATLRPGKLEVVQRWIGAQRWYAAKGRTATLAAVGSFRFVDPRGRGRHRDPPRARWRPGERRLGHLPSAR